MSQQFLRMLPPGVVSTWPPDHRTPPALALLDALEEQWLVLAADIDAVLDDAFPDSASDWALPYLAALLGLPPDAGRREIAYATALRRRKGTPAAMEDFAEVLTGWAARVVEGWRSTLWCQQLSHPVQRTASLDMRHGEHLLVGTALDPARRSVTPGGAHHPAAATVTVYPWTVLAFDQVQLAPLGDGRLSVHPLGVSAPMYLPPRPLEIASDAEDERPPGTPPALRPPLPTPHLPIRATWRLIDALGDVNHGPVWTLAAGHPLTGPGAALLGLTVDHMPVPWSAIGLTSLPGSGAPAPAPGTLLVDPNRGVVQPAADVTGTLRATAYRAVPGQLGPLASTAASREDVGVVIVVDPAMGTHPAGQTVVPTLSEALTAAIAAQKSVSPPNAPQLEIRLLTSDRLAAPPAPLTGAPKLTRWRIVAPVGFTPVVTGQLDFDLTDVAVELCGFYLAETLRLGARMAEVTLVGMATDPTVGAGVEVDPGAWGVSLEARGCLLGPIRVDLSAGAVRLTDCIVDGRGAVSQVCGGDPGGHPTRAALTAVDRFPPELVAQGVTFVGPVWVDQVWANDCLFTAGLRSMITSTGCVRYCHLGENDDPTAHPPAHRSRSGPLPRFGGVGFDSAGYYAPELSTAATHSAPPITTAASDGGEIGAYHHTRRGTLMTRLSQRLPEMAPLTVHPNACVAQLEE